MRHHRYDKTQSTSHSGREESDSKTQKKKKKKKMTVANPAGLDPPAVVSKTSHSATFWSPPSPLGLAHRPWPGAAARPTLPLPSQQVTAAHTRALIATALGAGARLVKL